MKHFLLFFLLSLYSFNVTFAARSIRDSATKENPFTAKASLIRYWNNQISNNQPKPSFLISKSSPLNAVDSAFYAKLADQNTLSTHLPSFCSSANLVCFSDSSPSLEKHDEDVNFSVYAERNFTNYGTNKIDGMDSFKNYSDDQNIAGDAFRRYSRGSSGHDDKFANYEPVGNVGGSSFSTYGKRATMGKGEFKNYASSKNVPDLKFTSYSEDTFGRPQSFSTYSENANSGDQGFASYGKKGTGIQNGFTSYGKGSNVMGSTFKNYGEAGTVVNDTFTSYSFDTNNPKNTFSSYGDKGTGSSESFSSYRDQANVGDDSFKSYAKKATDASAKFTNYGNSANIGSDTFSGYGKGSDTQRTQIGFKIYGVNNTFKDYQDKKKVSFAQYRESSSAKTSSVHDSGKKVNRWVEPGKFFRESMLKKGTVMPMPDITDKMPKRSFLPRSISSKLPFSSSKFSELKTIFHASENSSMETILRNTVDECERAPSPGETKRCVGSVEDMIDFAVSVLGKNVVVRSTEGIKGSKEDVMIGKVKGINGGKVTKSVSCHQSLYPYMVYYCHSVPKVRVYVADILDVKSKEKINKGVAICHVDTSSWSAGHGAFVALGSSPGKIEVCHWIFENDMTWATAD